MKTKILLRFLVTIVVLAAVVLGVWLIWFKPTNELEVFNMLTELQNDKQTAHEKALNSSVSTAKGHKGIKYNTKVEKCTIIGDNYSINHYAVEDTKSYGKIAYYRAYMFEGFSGKDLKAVNPYSDTSLATGSTLENMYNAVDKAFKYYYSYVQLAEDVSNKDVSQIKDIVKELNKKYDSFNENVDKVYAIIEQYTDSNSKTILSETASLYKNLAQDYYSIVKLYTDLTITVKDFVVDHVFAGNTAYDANTVSYNATLNAVNELTEKELKVFDEDGVVVVGGDYVNYSVDVAFAIKAEIKADVVKAYANVASNYSEGLIGEHGIFKLSRENKMKVVNDDVEAVSWFNETYLEDIKVLINALFVA